MLGHAILRQFSSSLLFYATGLGWAALGFRGFGLVIRCFGWAAPISYSLYALHYPLAVTATYLGFLPSTGLQIAGYVTIAFLAAFWGELVLQRFTNKHLHFRRSPVAVL
jgi:peptidoglycan/LPS O-acetylase OafA/YrhL